MPGATGRCKAVRRKDVRCRTVGRMAVRRAAVQRLQVRGRIHMFRQMTVSQSHNPQMYFPCAAVPAHALSRSHHPQFPSHRFL